MMHYKVNKQEDEIWLWEESYQPEYALKTESAFAQCNGYFGVRASGALPFVKGKRGMFVRGLFNRAYEDEVTELVNCPDLTGVVLKVNGQEITPEQSLGLSFRRGLHLMTGELAVEQKLKLSGGLQIELSYRRFASMENPHLFIQEMTVLPVNGDIHTGEYITGIDGQQTNSGVSHFKKVDCRVYDKQYMELTGYLADNDLKLLCACKVEGSTGKEPGFQLKRRGIFANYGFRAKKGQKLVFEKYSYIRGKDDSLDLNGQKRVLDECLGQGYEVCLAQHRRRMESMWEQARIRIQGADLEEEAAISFAQYHLMGMMPWNTSSCSIAAKGLTGEGYKGHAFWDTEIFMLPFFQYTFPEAARDLLEFRYHGLEGARKKAEDYGYLGAMFPWEVASSGEEETPLYAALNIHTGKANKVWSGMKEHHVTADIVYAIGQYYELTKDQDFMKKYGYEVVFEAASFWSSRAVKRDGQYVILDIIGPDEYTEHIDNNAYTNYMAKYCTDYALKLEKELQDTDAKLWKKLNYSLHLTEAAARWKDFSEHIYLPVPGEDGIIPQDDTFLSKKELPDMEKYKNSQVKQAILCDYSRDEVVDMQVLKQADTVMLLNLFPNLFPPEIVKKNVLYYEARTIHDSSLSYCAHAQACAAIGDLSLAWDFFQKCLLIDLDDNPNDSTDGIHSASLGGIWSCLIHGFAGIHFEEDTLKILPRLPQKWKKMQFSIHIRGIQIQVSLAKNKVILESKDSILKPLQVEIDHQKFDFDGYLQVDTEKK